MWSRFRDASLFKKEYKQQSQKNLNVNEEYLCAVRTKSFADFFVKVQLLVNNPPPASSSAYNSSCHTPLSENFLLDPSQDTITEILETSSVFSSSLTRSSNNDLKSLFSNYFNISAEASQFCSHLLKTLNQIQSDYLFIHHFIDAVDSKDHHSFSSEKLGFLVSELCSSLIPDKEDFTRIHEKHSSILHCLKSKRKKVARKIKLIKCFNRVSGVCITAACGVSAAAAMVLAMHTLTALLMGPAILSLPIKPLKRKIQSFTFLKYGFLRKIVKQLDAAAKGAYILNRDFDTISRLVSRLGDEVEHNRTMIRLCLERRSEDDRVSLRVLKEMKKYELGFLKQVEELEEHVYLCLVTINRARALVVEEISRGCVDG